MVLNRAVDIASTPSPEPVDKGLEGLLGRRHAIALHLDSARREEIRIKSDLTRVEAQVKLLEVKLQTADEMLEAYNGVRSSMDGTPSFLGMGRFAGISLKAVLGTIFQEEPEMWFSVPTLERKVLSQGFDGKIAHLNPAIHAACKRFLDKGYIETQESQDEGRLYRCAQSPGKSKH